MTDCRRFVERRWVGLASLSLVVLVACGGTQTAAPAPEMEAADEGLTSDFVSRSLLNPTSEVILMPCRALFAPSSINSTSKFRNSTRRPPIAV